jgi:glutaminyl-peptide cyclotransferase
MRAVRSGLPLRRVVAAVVAAASIVVPVGPVAARPAVPVATAHRFDAARALRTVRLQLAAGQRPAGSPQLRRVAEQLRARLPDGRFEDVPDHPGLRNVVGTLPGTEPAIVLGAHYDTEYHPPGFVGANDAAAAVGTVVEVARVLRDTRRPAGAPAIRFVLFDGEEEPAPTADFYADALRGSKAYVNAHPGATRAMILLDYIGGRGVRLPREGTSTPWLWQLVRGAARRVGVGAVFPVAVGTAITDDHAPFLRAGTPAVDLIDWDYAAKDTVRDTYDQLSAASVDAVGETMVELLRDGRAIPR